MKIGVTGHNGRLGKTLVDMYGWEPCYYHNVKEFDVIIHTMAFTDVDRAEVEVADCVYNNVVLTDDLRSNAKGKIIYISTDFVFDGNEGPYTEKSIPNPISVYGMSKFLGEKCLRSSDLIVRTTVLYDSHKSDFVTWVLENLHENDEVYVSKDYYTTPTNVHQLAEAINWLVYNPIVHKIINIAGINYITRFMFARMIADVWGYDNYKVQFSSKQHFGLAERPKQAGLVTLLAENLGIPLYSVQEGLERMKKENKYVSHYGR